MERHSQATIKEKGLAKIDHLVSRIRGEVPLEISTLDGTTVEIHRRYNARSIFLLPDGTTNPLSWNDPIHIEKNGTLLQRQRLSKRTRVIKPDESAEIPVPRISSVGKPAESNVYMHKGPCTPTQDKLEQTTAVSSDSHKESEDELSSYHQRISGLF